MVQNGILLTFTRPATIRLCFFDARLSFLLSKTSPNKAGQENNLTLSPLSPCFSARHGPIFYGSQSTSSPVHYVHYAFSIWLSCLLGFSIPTTSSLLVSPVSACSSVHLHLFMCVWRVFWNSLDKKELSKSWTFLSTEWNLATGICHSQFYLSSKTGKLEKSKIPEKEALYVLLAWVNLVTLNAFCVLCVWSSRWAPCTVDLTVLGKLSRDVIEVICNSNSTQVRCFQGATH